MTKRLLAVLMFLAVPASAQITLPTTAPGSGSASSTITNGTTATSGCVAGGVLRSISNLVECGAGFTYSTGVAGLGTASTTTGQFRIFHASHAFYTELTVSASQSANAVYTFPVDDGPAVSRIENNGSGVLSWKFDQTKFMTADQSDDTGSFVNVTDLGFSVAANTVYVFECRFMTNSAAATTGVQIAFNGPASPTNFNYAGMASNSATAFVIPTGTAYDSTTGLPTGATATQNIQQSFSGTLENGANAGTFTARLRTEVGSSAATIMRGSWCHVWTP